jgi:NAD(P)-dependent dehydrogenase (short-subunit alcohol dehydrogenase family)
MGDLDGKAAIVTGAAGGVGRATVRLLSERGARVVAVDLSPSVLELEAESVLALEGDVAVAATAKRAVAAGDDRWGRVDILVNNAAQIVWKSILETSEEEWDRVMAVNVRSMFLFCRAVIPLMEQQGGGAIVSTASISGLVGLAQQSAYSASKGAIVQLTRQLAIECAPARIRVNAVAPGAIDTPFLHRLLETADDPPAIAAAIQAEHPLGRWASAEEVARSIVFLASDAARFITGSVVPVDGGYTAR